MERIVAAIDSVRSEVRGLSTEEAKKRLVDALRARGAFLPLAEVELLAQQLSDPWATLKHPLRGLRALRRRREQAHRDEVESDRSQAESEQLGARLDDLLWSDALEAYSISSRGGYDGMSHVVAIRPFSETTAARIRQRAAPTPVTVERLGDLDS